MPGVHRLVVAAPAYVKDSDNPSMRNRVAHCNQAALQLIDQTHSRLAGQINKARANRSLVCGDEVRAPGRSADTLQGINLARAGKSAAAIPARISGREVRYRIGGFPISLPASVDLTTGPNVLSRFDSSPSRPLSGCNLATGRRRHCSFAGLETLRFSSYFCPACSLGGRDPGASFG